MSGDGGVWSGWDQRALFGSVVNGINQILLLFSFGSHVWDIISYHMGSRHPLVTHTWYLLVETMGCGSVLIILIGISM